ncbi:MAG: putative hemolysin [Chlamydiales bacterium]
MGLGTYFLIFLFLAGTSFLTVTSHSLHLMRKRLSKKTLDEVGKLFFYRFFQKKFFPKKEIEALYHASISAKMILTFCYASTVMTHTYQQNFVPFQDQNLYPSAAFTLFIAILASLLLGDLLPKLLAVAAPRRSLSFTAPVASVLLICCFPISYLFLKLSSTVSKFATSQTKSEQSSQIKDKIVGIIQESIPTAPPLDAEQKRLIESVITFKDRVVREVMIPRVDIFTLPATTSIKEAAKLLDEEGYSRIPVYSGTVDKIIGVLMYKDILALYAKGENTPQLNQPIQTIVKPVLYTPETKKISHLLQEFRHKQMHLAIVVDEYGGTEGLVTIEDILEEIVGEIEDEHDTEEKLFSVLPHGGWIVDARMSILDIEEHLGLRIPQDGEYDTIGGYVFHRAGAIPSKGLLIHHNDFELEILSSNDRCIKKVRVTPLSPSKEHSQESLSS